MCFDLYYVIIHLWFGVNKLYLYNTDVMQPYGPISAEGFPADSLNLLIYTLHVL